MILSPKFLAGAVLVVALTVLASCGYAAHQRTLREQAEARYTEQSIELEGAHRALLAKPKEIVKWLSPPPAVKEAAKSGKATVIGGIKGKAESNVINIPCPPTPAPPSEPPTDVKNIPPPNETPVYFGLEGDLLIVKVNKGAVEWTGRLAGEAHDKDRTWSRTIDFDPANINLDVKVSTEIAEAIEEHNESWAKKHLRFQCPGIGVVYNGSLSGGLTCTYGLTW